MKSRSIALRYILAVPLLACAVMVAAFTESPDTAGSSSAVAGVTSQYLAGLERLAATLGDLNRAATDLSDEPGSAELLRTRYLAARAAYKRIEFLVERCDDYAAWKLNGVPLPKINTSDGLRSVILPEGFQVIEEMVFSDDPAAQRSGLLARIAAMEGNQRRLARGAQEMELIDRYVFEAARDQVVRAMTLGITGFDTPGSGAGIMETAYALEGVRDAIGLYHPTLRRKDARMGESLDSLFDGAIGYLRSGTDFDRFDRIRFIRDYGNPLLALLLRAHLALGIETFSESVSFNSAVNYEATNIFASGFLNPYYYSSDARESASPERSHLGRILFFDPVLSGNNQRSCASCHRPELAFTDGESRSMAFHGKGRVERNAPTLINGAFQRGQFHDARAEFFEDQVEMVLLNANEMGSSFEAILGKLRESPDYDVLFRRAFRGTPDTTISYPNIKRALGSYMRTLVALNSPFDRYMRGELPAIDPAVTRGFNLFMGKGGCGTCHFAPTFNGTVPPDYTETEWEVLGVPKTADTLHPELDPDEGRYGVFLDGIHRHAFKTPTVRNVEHTAPYMHNGIYRTLEEVVDFYDRGGGAGMGLDVSNQTLPAERLNLSREEKRDLIAFMRALTDTAGLQGAPPSLPAFPGHPDLNRRRVAGVY